MRSKVREEFPIVKKYEDEWPVKAVVKMRLKATAEKMKRNKVSVQYCAKWYVLT
jgi:hypothetical protein